MEREVILAEATQLPLEDAAYLLWVSRFDVTPQQSALPAWLAKILSKSRLGLGILLRLARPGGQPESATADRRGRTYEWLQETHPGATPGSVGEAIRAAIELDRAAGHIADGALRAALDEVRRTHPGYEPAGVLKDGVQVRDPELDRLLAEANWRETEQAWKRFESEYAHFLPSTLKRAWARAEFLARM